MEPVRSDKERELAKAWGLVAAVEVAAGVAEEDRAAAKEEVVVAKGEARWALSTRARIPRPRPSQQLRQTSNNQRKPTRQGENYARWKSKRPDRPRCADRPGDRILRGF
jgi:hypothetical protein